MPEAWAASLRAEALPVAASTAKIDLFAEALRSRLPAASVGEVQRA